MRQVADRKIVISEKQLYKLLVRVVSEEQAVKKCVRCGEKHYAFEMSFDRRTRKHTCDSCFGLPAVRK